MNLLIDESVPAMITRWLREQGYDADAVAEDAPSTADPAVAERAAADDRVLITRDRDFGELAVRHRIVMPGCLLLRTPDQRPRPVMIWFIHVWEQVERDLLGHLIIAKPGRIRIRPMSPPTP